MFYVADLSRSHLLQFLLELDGPQCPEQVDDVADVDPHADEVPGERVERAEDDVAPEPEEEEADGQCRPEVQQSSQPARSQVGQEQEEVCQLWETYRLRTGI